MNSADAIRKMGLTIYSSVHSDIYPLIIQSILSSLFVSDSVRLEVVLLMNEVFLQWIHVFLQIVKVSFVNRAGFGPLAKGFLVFLGEIQIFRMSVYYVIFLSRKRTNHHLPSILYPYPVYKTLWNQYLS